MQPQQTTPALDLEAGHQSLLSQVSFEAGPRMTGIVLGTLTRLDALGLYVSWPHGPAEVLAQTTAPLTSKDLGRQVALMFLGGSISHPLILGLIQDPIPLEPAKAKLELEAKEEISLKCGKASITLRKDGKILLKGTHLLSRSSGPNKIKGASVSIN